MIRYSYLVMIFLLLSFFVQLSCQKTHDSNINTENRIISLAPHITEIIYALGDQNELVAVTDYCRYPEAATLKEKVGGLLNPNIEKMIRLKPTHLFGLPSHKKLATELQKYDLEVTMMPNENISDVINTIKRIGDIIGKEKRANDLVKQINSQLFAFKTRKSEKSISAVLMIGREDGTLRNITAVGKNTYIDELWRLVGGKNCYADLPTHYGTINLESLLLRDPDVIIEFEMNGNRGVKRAEIAPEWDYLADLKAVKNKNIFIIEGNHTMIPGPRMVLLAEDFSKIIELVGEASMVTQLP